MASKDARQSRAAGAPADSAARPLCFIIDDEPGIRQIIAHSLRDFGIETREFDSAPAVLAALEQANPQLCFLDVTLAGSDAIDVIRGLAQHRYAGPVQIMSGRDPALLEEVRRVGERHALDMLPVLPKPFRAAAIKRIAREHCGAETMNAPHGSNGCGRSPLDAPQFTLERQFQLDQLLDSGLLQLWYQPKIDLRRRSLAGAEGLIRAVHPEHGVIPPGAFLPDATEQSMIRLTEFVLLAAMRDWPEFAEQGFSARVALNVPVEALVKLPISTIVREHRPTSGGWPGLILEVTEDQVVRDIALAHEVATQLKIYDIELSIDDFGTGYSHLARLRELPFAELKLDRNLVANCGADETNAALCQTAIDLAHRFGSRAVAEGIEKTSELETLQKMSCDLGQGFLFAAPMTKDRFVSLLRSQSGQQNVTA